MTSGSFLNVHSAGGSAAPVCGCLSVGVATCFGTSTMRMKTSSSMQGDILQAPHLMLLDAYLEPDELLAKTSQRFQDLVFRFDNCWL